MLELILLIVLLYVVYHFIQKRDYKDKPLPPGPTPWPLLGNIGTLAKDNNVFMTFRELRKEYGDVFSLRIGPTLMVVFNGYDTLKEAFIQQGDDMSDRPDLFIFKEVSEHEGM